MNTPDPRNIYIYFFLIICPEFTVSLTPSLSVTQSVGTWPVAQRTAQYVFGILCWDVVRRS